jgi:succinate dehydrogenase / fumarate reductase membrane anchor subunit
MVASITNFGRNGLHDWVIQRATAVIMAVYTVFMMGFFLTNPDLQYADWKELFSGTCMRVLTLLTLLSLSAHAWVGMWTISTDYLKSVVIRFSFQAVCFIAMFTFLIWGIEIIWGV